VRGTAGDLGQPSGGELNNGPAPAAAPDSMINRTITIRADTPERRAEFDGAKGGNGKWNLIEKRN
jgi:hypothetical protein